MTHAQRVERSTTNNEVGLLVASASISSTPFNSPSASSRRAESRRVVGITAPLAAFYLTPMRTAMRRGLLLVWMVALLRHRLELSVCK